MQLKLQNSAEWPDLAVLEPLCKRNHSQHRRTDYFLMVAAVLRCGKLHQQVNVAGTWHRLASVTQTLSDVDGAMIVSLFVPRTQRNQVHFWQ